MLLNVPPPDGFGYVVGGDIILWGARAEYQHEVLPDSPNRILRYLPGDARLDDDGATRQHAHDRYV